VEIFAAELIVYGAVFLSSALLWSMYSPLTVGDSIITAIA
jgi:hypothetical protein